MNITKDIIEDLLPIYLSQECSEDTRKLIEEYFKSDPVFKKQVKQMQSNPLPNDLPDALDKDDELFSLLKTRRMLKWRSFLLALAIFCTLVPFSFIYTAGNFYWFFREAPLNAAFYAAFAASFWTSYFIVRRKFSVL